MSREEMFPATEACIDRSVQAWRTVPGVKATNKALVERHTRLVEALSEIESFPVSGYHAGEAQRIAHAVLSEYPPE